jgi:ribonucleotide monophosphatase NagD (HAD superfamily)
VLNVGTDSLGHELAACGLQPITVEAAEEGAAVEVVLVGGGARLDFEVLRVASSAVREGAALWATNKDPTYPTARGLVPGTGAIVASIEVASGVEARNLGKPEPALFEAALRRLGADRPLMAGDSLHSDIAGAVRAGLATALILTGRDSRADLESAPAQPDLIYEDLAALAADLA